MRARISRILDRMSDFFAHRKGLLPMIGVLLVVANFVLQITTSGWLASSNLLLHLGVVVAILGILIAWAL